MNALAAQRTIPWRSKLGIASIIFLFYGLTNAVFAIFVPLTLHQAGPAGFGGLVMGTGPDDMFLGRSFEQMVKNDPALGSYLVAFMDTM
jgi:hypothetical protein